MSYLSILVVMFALLAGPIAQARVVELRHDILLDHQLATAVCGFAIGERFAVQFTPPEYPAGLLKVRVLLVNAALGSCAQAPVSNIIEMPLEIYHMTSSVPGTSLGYYDGFVYSNDTVLNEVNLATENLSIQDGSFLIAFTILSNDASPVHDSSNNAKKALNFIYGDIGLGTQWYSFAELAPFSLDPKGDWVVRIDVEIPDQPQDGGTDAGVTDGSDPGPGDTGPEDAGVDAGPGDAPHDGTAPDSGTADGAAEDADAGPGDDAGDTSVSDPGPGEDQPSGCTQDADCAGGQICDTDSGVCIQVSCSTDADCLGGYVCRDNVCRRLCTGDGDCRGGEACTTSSGVKICLPIEQNGGSDSCGCSPDPVGSAGPLVLMAVIVATLCRRRRRRRI